MIATMPVTDSRQLRDAFACFPSGVTALCGLVDNRPVGMAASSFTSVSLDPPLVSVCIQRGAATWEALRGIARVGVSFLSEMQDIACRQLAAKTADRFASINWKSSQEGAVFIDGAPVWLECTIQQCIAAGDHEIILLRVEGLQMTPDVPPLIFHGSRFKQLRMV